MEMICHGGPLHGEKLDVSREKQGIIDFWTDDTPEGHVVQAKVYYSIK